MKCENSKQAFKHGALVQGGIGLAMGGLLNFIVFPALDKASLDATVNAVNAANAANGQFQPSTISATPNPIKVGDAFINMMGLAVLGALFGAYWNVSESCETEVADRRRA